MDLQDEKVIDGEIQAEAGTVPTQINSSQVLINMEALIKSHITSIDRLQDEAKKLKGMLDDIFSNDPTYNNHDKAAKEASKVKAATRAEILKRPQAAELANKFKTIKSEVKEMQNALSDYLQEYNRMSGVNEIEGEDGEVREIVYEAKLIKKAFRP